MKLFSSFLILAGGALVVTCPYGYGQSLTDGAATKASSKPTTPTRSKPLAEHTSRGRAAIKQKLQRIMVDFVDCQNLPLADAIEQLDRLCLDRDSDHEGINFLLIRDVAPPDAIVNATPGLPNALSSSETADPGPVPITVHPKLKHLRLIDTLDVIIKGAGVPIRYSIEDYGVSFALDRSPTANYAYYARTFRVDPNTFKEGLEAVTGVAFGAPQTGSPAGGNGGAGGGGNAGLIVPGVQPVPGGSGSGGAGAGSGAPTGSSGAGGISNVTKPGSNQDTQAKVRQFFTTFGTDLGPTAPAPAGKSVIFDAQNGVLFVRSTVADLGQVSRTLAGLALVPDDAGGTVMKSGTNAMNLLVAKLLLEQGKLEEAEQALTTILKADPDNTEARRCLEQTKSKKSNPKPSPTAAVEKSPHLWNLAAASPVLPFEGGEGLDQNLPNTLLAIPPRTGLTRDLLLPLRPDSESAGRGLGRGVPRQGEEFCSSDTVTMGTTEALR